MTIAEEMFGKRFKDLTDKEKKEYHKRSYKYGKRYQKQLEWQEMCKNLDTRRKRLEILKNIQPLEQIKSKIMALDIETVYLHEIEKIINYEIENIKGDNK